MTLRLLDRIATLVRADAHGVVEALEEQSLLLKQSLREAELELLDKRARLAALGEEEARVRGRVERHRAEIAKLDEDVALALAGDREEIARFAIRRLLPLRRALAALEREGAVLAQSRAALAERLAAQEAEFEELRARVRARLARPRGAEDTCDEPFASAPVDEAEVELELLRRRGANAEEMQR
jgi:phage shock protein A